MKNATNPRSRGKYATSTRPLGRPTRVRFVLVAALASLATVLSCVRESAPPHQAQGAIQPETIRAHMAFLSDDLLEGRGTGTRGYRIAARYVASQFEALGLEPAGEDGSYYQLVPLREASIDAEASTFALVSDEGTRGLDVLEDVLIHPSAMERDVSVRGELSFAGYGIVDESLARDDYQDVDVRGKLAVVLSGAPAALASTERAVLSSLQIKAQEASKRGALGIVVIRTPTDRARRPWNIVRQRSLFPTMDWLSRDGVPQRFPKEIRAVVTLGDAIADRMLDDAGIRLEELVSRADAGPTEIHLRGAAAVRTVSTHRELQSPNVIARLQGRGLANEHVVFSSHLDHVGIGPPIDGDAIYNGAYDNASGIAVLLAVAQSLSEGAEPMERSLLFLAVTAEEKGLLGSDYFARHPTVERASLIANVNVDGALMLHPFLDFVPFGAEHSTIDQTVRSVAREMSLEVSPDFMPEEVIFVRSDQYSFVRQGIPALYTFVGNETASEVDGRELLRNWMNDVYHRPNDDMSQEMDFEAGARYAELNRRIGVELANREDRPRWNEGDFLGRRFSRDAN